MAGPEQRDNRYCLVAKNGSLRRALCHVIMLKPLSSCQQVASNSEQVLTSRCLNVIGLVGTAQSSAAHPLENLKHSERGDSGISYAANVCFAWTREWNQKRNQGVILVFDSRGFLGAVERFLLSYYVNLYANTNLTTSAEHTPSLQSLVIMRIHRRTTAVSPNARTDAIGVHMHGFEARDRLMNPFGFGSCWAGSNISRVQAWTVSCRDFWFCLFHLMYFNFMNTTLSKGLHYCYVYCMLFLLL